MINRSIKLTNHTEHLEDATIVTNKAAARIYRLTTCTVKGEDLSTLPLAAKISVTAVSTFAVRVQISFSMSFNDQQSSSLLPGIFTPSTFPERKRETAVVKDGYTSGAMLPEN